MHLNNRIRGLMIWYSFFFATPFIAFAQVQTPTVAHVYPGTDTIPSNILRFYVEFSEPMREGSASSHIYIVDSSDRVIKHLFFDSPDELWSADRTLLTLLVDPGRVKSGLRGNQLFGRALKVGQYYSFVLDSMMQTMRGDYLKSAYHAKFFVTSTDTFYPQVKNWSLKLPMAGTFDKIEIHFNEVIDHVSALSSIVIQNKKGEIMKGKIMLSNHDRVWKFIPQRSWLKGAYFVRVSNRLEDLAANNLNGKFEHEAGAIQSETHITSLTFLIK
jgi:hypothetical protein